MEAAAGVVAGGSGGRVISLPMSSRQEWRVVPEHHSNASEEEMDRSKLGQLDERTIYEQGREQLDLDLCSITVDGSLGNDILQQHLHDIVRQQEHLQRSEIKLREVIARNSFEAQIKEHANAVVKLQEQLHEREQAIHDLGRKMEEKDRELHAIKLDNEAAWAKEDLFIEQNKELATVRRERDTSEAERGQHLQQIHDLQEHIQDKERQLIELQEQLRVAQETILYKDEQLREAQTWIARVQESLQAELRDRTEQYNHLWLGCQRQFAEMERLHLHTVKQLQLELADSRERSGTYTDESRAQTTSKDTPQFGQNNGGQLDSNGSGTLTANSGVLPNGNADNIPSFVSSGSPPTQADHVPGLPIAPSSLLGMPAYLPPGQMTALHPYVMHQQGVAHPSHVPQSHVGQFHPLPAISSIQQWQNQQAVSDVSQLSTQNQFPQPQNDHNSSRSDTNYNYEISVNGQALRPDFLDAHISRGLEPVSAISPSMGEPQVIESMDKSYMVAPQPQQGLQQISSQFHDALRLNPLEQHSEIKEKNVLTSTNHGLEAQGLTTEKANPLNNTPADAPIHSANFSETPINVSSAVFPVTFVSAGQTNISAVGKTQETSLLDERSLLACIVRTIPPGVRVQISSTLPNRLGKMLQPLCWHNYKKKYGKLDDFVAGHPELFVIEGDYIQLREGAQKIIATTAAIAKVAAAAAASAPYSSLLPPSVAVTPMAQTYRPKKAPSIESSEHVKTEVMHQKLQSNGVCFGDFSNVKILSKPRDALEVNGTERVVGQNKGSSNGRSGVNFVGKQQGRTTGAASTSRR